MQLILSLAFIACQRVVQATDPAFDFNGPIRAAVAARVNSAYGVEGMPDEGMTTAVFQTDPQFNFVSRDPHSLEYKVFLAATFPQMVDRLQIFKTAHEFQLGHASRELYNNYMRGLVSDCALTGTRPACIALQAFVHRSPLNAAIFLKFGLTEWDDVQLKSLITKMTDKPTAPDGKQLRRIATMPLDYIYSAQFNSFRDPFHSMGEAIREIISSYTSS